MKHTVYAILLDKMKRYRMLGVGKISRGYTIVEALIFLAVSGALLIASAGVISGRQEKARFTQAIVDIDTDLNDIFNDVSTGFYPSQDRISCSVNGIGDVTLSNSATTIEQGSNADCIFAGKLLSPLSTDKTKYSTYTLVTARTASALLSGKVKALGINGVGVNDERGNNVNMEIVKIVKSTGPPYQTYNSLAIVSDLGSGGTAPIGNAAKLKLYGYNGAIGSTDGLLTWTAVASQLEEVRGFSVIFCLAQGGSTASNDKKGFITITPQLTTTRVIGSQDPACV